MKTLLVLTCVALLVGEGHPLAAEARFWQAQGTGALVQSVQPGTTTPCDSSNVCQVTISGKLTLEGIGVKGVNSGSYTSIETVDFSAPTYSGVLGTCYYYGGQMSIVLSNKAEQVLFLQGSACQSPPGSSGLLFSGAFGFGGVGIGGMGSITEIEGVNGSSMLEQVFLTGSSPHGF